MNGVLRLSPPKAPRGARLPFDFLLHSLAEEYGTRAICVTLSGLGADGSLGLRAVKDKGGLVVVQDPEEVGYDGMPCSAITTGLVDAVLPLARIPGALASHGRQAAPHRERGPAPAAADPVAGIIELLRTHTRHDFTPYKRGTLERRIERRMAISSLRKDETARYLTMLGGDAGELDLLGRDLLIHVTGLFRDPQVYAALAETVISGLVAGQAPDQPLRVWVAGCSTGEETYSVVILFREAAMAAGRDIKLQVFASDIDAEAVAMAREGWYPATIATDVSAGRLARFFFKEDEGGYRVLPELRAAVVFTVQDLLADPPFSRLDLLSCRNLMICLGPEAQAKAVALFHFALKQGGVLLLGSAETVGEADGRFEVIERPSGCTAMSAAGAPATSASPAPAATGRVPRVRDQGGRRPATPCWRRCAARRCWTCTPRRRCCATRDTGACTLWGRRTATCAWRRATARRTW